MDDNKRIAMSSEHINNFPPTNMIFGSQVFSQGHKKKNELSAISRAELMGGFQVTADDLAESSRFHNPFDIQKSIKSSSNSSYQSRQSRKIHFYPTDSPSPKKRTYASESFQRRSNDIRNFINSERERLINDDQSEYLCSHTRKELDVFNRCKAISIRKQMMKFGLL